MAERGKCGACRADVIFAFSEANNLVVVDAEESGDGDVVIVDGKAVHRRGDLFEEMIDGPRHHNHRKTCPARTCRPTNQAPNAGAR